MFYLIRGIMCTIAKSDQSTLPDSECPKFSCLVLHVCIVILDSYMFVVIGVAVGVTNCLGLTNSMMSQWLTRFCNSLGRQIRVVSGCINFRRFRNYQQRPTLQSRNENMTGDDENAPKTSFYVVLVPVVGVACDRYVAHYVCM